MKKISKTGFWVYYHAGILVFSITASLTMQFLGDGKLFTPETWVKISSIFIMSIAIGYLAIYMVNRSKKLTRRQMTKWVIPGLLIFYAGAFIISNISVSLSIFGFFIATGRDLGEYFPQLFRLELPYANVRLLSWLLFFSIVFFYVLWRKSAEKEQQLNEEMLKFQYQTLKSQINPHFLFNSLNTLTELVYENPSEADNYIQGLSKIYRYIIDNEETRLIPLEKEIDFVIEYFRLQQARGRDKLVLNIVIPEMEKFRIIPVSLQLVVENAIKHNSFSLKLPLVIDIVRDDGFVVVSNKIQRKNIMEQSTGKGLKNLRDRVRLITGKEVVIEESGDKYSVSIPLILL